MSTLTTFRVTSYWFGESEVTLQVNFDVLTPELAAEINGFWTGAEGRLQEESGDVVRAVVRMFGAEAIRFFMDEGGVRFDSSGQGNRHWTGQVLKSLVEGWPDIDNLGILILSADVSAVDYDDVTLESLPTEAA